MNTETEEISKVDTLEGIPGLGPVRQRLLIAAGITTRTALAAATLEQVISLTGAPRAAAERILAAVTDVPSPKVQEESAPEIPSTPELTPVIEATIAAETAAAVAPVATLEPELTEKPTITRIERSALQAQRAIADASRRAEPDSKLSRMLTRFAILVDSVLGRLAEKPRPAVLRRVTDRIDNISDRLEALTRKKAKAISPKREKRLRQRLKRTRDSLKRSIKATES